ncbi:MAG: hypothetical protein HY905_00160 [Deltaproteobacteria bacterium]|nr:hypothetical protein [Deltaproteobacteria bacterium]
MRRIELVVVGFLAVAALSSCNRQAEANNSPGSSATPRAPMAPPAPPPATAPGADSTGATAVSAPASPVARIVFIGKENACQCTRAAIDASWAALQEALAGVSIPIEQLYQDTQAAQVAPYKELQAFFALPAIYFLDASGGFLNQLQGEVTAGQIRAILFPGS